MHTHTFTYPQKPQPGDKIAILSPSSGLPGLFPAVFEQGLQRLRDVFQLAPVEYPTTRKMNAPLEERARDVYAAFADPEIKAIICSIGGDDQLKLLKYLDADLIRAHPKPFLGYSDNTNLHVLLWNLGIVSYYGGSIMVQFGRGGAMHPYTVEYLKRALFEHGTFEIRPAPEYTDEEIRWENVEVLRVQPVMFPNTGWQWVNAGNVVEGITWGGNLEIIDWQLRANRYILPEESYRGKILYLETSEELPSAVYIYRVLMCMGERGLLQQFAALLVARPKAWSFESPHNAEEKARYIREQEEAIKSALAEYHPRVLAVFNLDFGHTDPQCVIPNGGWIQVDGVQKRIFVRY
jgi:muramoyltetrapeptide carboxypeptidase LdcA involved in peptidoglycan recycling